MIDVLLYLAAISMATCIPLTAFIMWRETKARIACMKLMLERESASRESAIRDATLKVLHGFTEELLHNLEDERKDAKYDH